MPPFVQNILDQITRALAGNTAKLDCLEKKLNEINRYQQLELGKLGEFSPRDANKLQFVKEATVNEPTDVNIRDEGGYFPRDGYIANLGDDSFKIILYGTRADQTTGEFTITPNTSYALRSPIGKIKIIPIGGNSAFYQVSVI
jgi:hypothetical protein